MLKILGLWICAISLAVASDPVPGIKIYNEYYEDANQVTSITPSLEITTPLKKHWNAQVKLEVDGVTGASRVATVDAYNGVTAASEVPTIVDGITGASTVEFRKSQTTHVTYSNSGSVLSFGYYTSLEDDYFSQSPSIDFAQDFFDRNTTIGLSLSYFDDKFVQSKVSEIGSADKNIASIQLSVTQSLTPLLLVHGSVQRMLSWGYLGKPYNPVVLAIKNPIDEEKYQIVSENVPNRKLAYAFTTGFVQGFKLYQDYLGSLRFQYRYYTDSWVLNSHTLEAQLSQYLWEGVFLRFDYRYYIQSRASFVYAEYSGQEQFITSDIRFYPFSSHLVGVKMGARLPDEWIEEYPWLPNSCSMQLNYTTRNTQGNLSLYQFYDADESYYQWNLMTGVEYEF